MAAGKFRRRRLQIKTTMMTVITAGAEPIAEKIGMTWSRTGLASRCRARLTCSSKAVDSLVTTASAILANSAMAPSDAAANPNSRRANQAGGLDPTPAEHGAAE